MDSNDAAKNFGRDQEIDFTTLAEANKNDQQIIKKKPLQQRYISQQNPDQLDSGLKNDSVQKFKNRSYLPMLN